MITLFSNPKLPFRKEPIPPDPEPELTLEEIIQKRARLMYDAQWHTVAETYPKWGSTFWHIGQHTKLPYASTRGIGKRILFDTSYESFVTACNNPESIMYKEDLRTPSGLYVNAGTASGYFGIVCNEVVAYALGEKETPNSWQWHVQDRAYEVPQDAQHAKIGHILRQVGHVAIVSDVVRDGFGNVQSVEVIEASMPNVIKRTFTAPQFNSSMLSQFVMYGWQVNENIKYEPLPQDIVFNPDIKLSYGNKSVYKLGENIGINVVNPLALLLIWRDGVVVQELQNVNSGVLDISFDAVGDYEVGGVNTIREKFKVSDVIITQVTPQETTQDGSITVNFTSLNCNPLSVMVKTQTDNWSDRIIPRELTSEEKEGGFAIIEGFEHTGALSVIVTGENEYGRVNSDWYPITVL